MKTSGALKVEARGDRDIVMVREFDAPRTLVFAALTRPELIRRWLGVFGEWSMPVCEVDLRIGGGYRYVWRGGHGEEMGMRGTYREIVPDERIVATEVFDEPWYPGEAVDTMTLTESRGRTTLSTVVRYASRAARDGVMKSPMASGVEKGYEALDMLLAAGVVGGVS